MSDAVEAFFEGLPARASAERIAGVNTTYAFEIDGAGTWTVDVRDTGVTVSEGARPDVDCTISASAETFGKIVSGAQGATTAYMSGKLRVGGDLTAAMKLQQLF